MICSFKDLSENGILEDSRVLAIVGSHSLFNNIAADKAKEFVMSQAKVQTAGEAMLAEFGIKPAESEKGGTVVPFDTFVSVVGNANINGKWFCKVVYKELNKKQLDIFFKYIKEPSKNGMLVVVNSDFKDYKYILNSNVFKSSKYANALKLIYPERNDIKEVISDLFLDRGKAIDKPSIEMFMIRMNNEFDKYAETIEMMCVSIKEKSITLSVLKDAMSGIQYFDIEDFILELTKPVTTTKTTSKKIYKMIDVLREKYEYTGIVNISKSNILEYIQFRMLINTGVIPIKLDYFFNDILKVLGKEHPFAKYPEWKFRKKAMIAAQTSLKDWEYMYLILSSVNFMDTMSYERKLYELINRQVLTESNILSAVKFNGNMDYALKRIDRTIIIKEGEIEDGQDETEVAP